MSIDKQTFRYKMVLFGHMGVGKTSLVERFVNDRFEEEYISTLGYNVMEKIIEHEKCEISLMIYDIGGQEKFRDLRKKYAEGANTAFLVYDITDQDSFDEITTLKNDLEEFAGVIPFILVGNKADLAAKRQISTADAKKLNELIGATHFFETSAKTGKGVEDAFNQLAIATYQRSKL